MTMPLIKIPKKVTEDLFDFPVPIHKDFHDAYRGILMDIANRLGDLPDGAEIDMPIGYIRQGVVQQFLTFLRKIDKEDKDLIKHPHVRAYLAKHQPKPRLTAQEKKLQEMKDKANAIHRAIKKLSDEQAPSDKIESKMQALEKLKARIAKLEPTELA